MTALSSAATAAVNAVQEIGNKLRKHYGTAVSLRCKSSLAADVVTTLDIEAERFLAERLAGYDATIGFAGEESEPVGSAKRFWLVDPIDGTGHFIRGTPFCTTMIALVEEGEVVFSTIYNFVTRELFVAELQKGATLNGNPLHVSERPLSDAYLSVETDMRSERSISTYVRLRSRAVVLHTINCGYEYGLIAQGRLEGRISFDPFGKDWDFAPGSLLVTEAGGRVTNIGSPTYDFKNHNLIAANLAVHEELSRPGSPLEAYR